MRNGDSYKIKHLFEAGEPVKDICHRFRNSYSAEEVKRFLPQAVVSDSDTPKPKKKARKRLVAKG